MSEDTIQDQPTTMAPTLRLVYMGRRLGRSGKLFHAYRGPDGDDYLYAKPLGRNRFPVIGAGQTVIVVDAAAGTVRTGEHRPDWTRDPSVSQEELDAWKLADQAAKVQADQDALVRKSAREVVDLGSMTVDQLQAALFRMTRPQRAAVLALLLQRLGAP